MSSATKENIAKMKADLQTAAQFRTVAKCDPTKKPWYVVAEAYQVRTDSAFLHYRDLIIREG